MFYNVVVCLDRHLARVVNEKNLALIIYVMLTSELRFGGLIHEL